MRGHKEDFFKLTSRNRGGSVLWQRREKKFGALVISVEETIYDGDEKTGWNITAERINTLRRRYPGLRVPASK